MPRWRTSVLQGAARGRPSVARGGVRAQEEEDEDQILGLWGSIGWMGVLTAFISLLSEYLVDAIEGAAEGWGIPYLFIGVIRAGPPAAVKRPQRFPQ